MSPKTFWRIAPVTKDAVNHDIESSTLTAPIELFTKIRPRQGITLASWDAEKQLGNVHALGVVKAVEPADCAAEVLWRNADITLRPNPSGRTYWTNRPFFQFAKEVAVRYMLADLFSEHFPEYEDIEFAAPPRAAMKDTRTYIPINGYVYVIRSQYGFKIGKTVNIKSRTRLFEVKLPFPITVEHYAWFEDYSQAERMFHDMFESKRLEGEWFDLDQADVAKIKTYGKPTPTGKL